MARNVRSGGRWDTGLVVGCLALAVVALVMPRRARESVAQALRSTVLSPLVMLESRAATIRASVVARHDVLLTRGGVATLALSARAVSDENATLRRLLGLSARLQDGFVPAELLPTRGAEDDFTLTLNVGTAAGVQPFSAVVTADGLVGMVQSADASTSFAITWAHPDFRVSAMSVDNAAYGIVQPHLGVGAERWLLELRGVPFRSKLDTGVLVVSSGLGATYPRGIPIGTVLGEISTPEKWARTYLIKPSVLPAAIGPVLVLLPQRAARGVNHIWTNVTSADSAARAIAATGDSIAKRAALDELSARRAALDSAATDSLQRDSTGALSRVLIPDSAKGTKIVRPDSARLRLPIVPPTVPPRTGPPPERLP